MIDVELRLITNNYIQRYIYVSIIFEGIYLEKNEEEQKSELMRSN